MQLPELPVKNRIDNWYWLTPTDELFEFSGFSEALIKVSLIKVVAV